MVQPPRRNPASPPNNPWDASPPIEPLQPYDPIAAAEAERRRAENQAFFGKLAGGALVIVTAIGIGKLLRRTFR
jgi:hypothetical protein